MLKAREVKENKSEQRNSEAINTRTKKSCKSATLGARASQDRGLLFMMNAVRDRNERGGGFI